MKILFFYPGSLRDPKRGTPLRVCAIYRHLSRLADVHLIAYQAPEDAIGPCTLLSGGGYGSFLSRIRLLRSFFLQHRGELFYGHTHNALFSALIARACGMKTCVDLHSLYHEERELPPRRKKFLDCLYHFLVRRLDAITTVSTLLSAYYGNDCAHVYTLHGGVDYAALRDLSPAPLSVQQPVIAYCGNMRTYQGVLHLLESLALLKDKSWSLLLISSSPDTSEVEQLLTHYDLRSRTLLLRDLSQSAVFRHLRSAQVSVVPRPLNAITQYAFASKLPEYLASGTAVIATDIGDARLLVRQGETGWLVQPGSPRALADAIFDAISHPEQCMHVADNACKLIQQQYDWSTLVHHLYHSFLIRL